MSGVMSPSARYTGTAYIITCIMPKPATNNRHSAALRLLLRQFFGTADIVGVSPIADCGDRFEDRRQAW
jgi:hypothetical protein